MRGRVRSGVVGNLLLVVLLIAMFVAGPRIVDGYTALEWTRFYAAQGEAGTRTGESARQAARWAVRTLDRAAPMPMAAEAARVALDLGNSLESRDPAAALILSTELRTGLQRIRSSAWRGLRLGEVAEDVQHLEERARAALAAQRPGP